MSYSEEPANEAYGAGRPRTYPDQGHDNDRGYGRDRPRSYDDHDGFQSRSGRGGRGGGGRGGYQDGGYGRGGYGRGRGYESRGGEGSYRSRDDEFRGGEGSYRGRDDEFRGGEGSYRSRDDEFRGGEGSYRSRDEQGYRQDGFRKRTFDDASRGPPRGPPQDIVEGSLNGTVKWFNATKGFGFITPEDGGAEVFVHHSAIQSGGFRSLNDGDQVSYNMQTGRDGRTKAADVTITASAPPDAGPKRTRRHDDYEHA